jgi:hypothetical protein
MRPSYEGIPTFLAVKMTGLDTTHPTSTLQIGSHVLTVLTPVKCRVHVEDVEACEEQDRHG